MNAPHFILIDNEIINLSTISGAGKRENGQVDVYYDANNSSMYKGQKAETLWNYLCKISKTISPNESPQDEDSKQKLIEFLRKEIAIRDSWMIGRESHAASIFNNWV